jgi:riboflavin synthase
MCASPEAHWGWAVSEPLPIRSRRTCRFVLSSGIPSAMFTGLVQSVGEVINAVPWGEGNTGIAIEVRVSDAGDDWLRVQPGDSVSVSGCCLTLVGQVRTVGGRAVLRFQAVAETIRRVKPGLFQPGAKVNLERAVTASSVMGGHIVQGHVDGLATVTHVQTGADWRVQFRPGFDFDRGAGASLMEYITPKGSVSIDGVSLTIAEVVREAGTPAEFGVALIPTTLDKTTLGVLRPGDTVNLEMDVIAKTVVFWLRNFGGRSG